ncbi:MAG: hypothetical protein ACK5T3_10005 [Betaproteobacteria bacterium]
MYNLFDRALSDRAPKFRAELEASGELNWYLDDLARGVRDAISVSGLDKQTQALPYLEKVRAMNAAAASARETAIAEALQNLPDERPQRTSP